MNQAKTIKLLGKLGLYLAIFGLQFALIRNLDLDRFSVKKSDLERPEAANQTAMSKNYLPEINDKKPKKVVYLTVTAYSSTVDQTDADPFTTASGTKVREGIIAHNYLPMGTKVKFPEAFGGQVFTVEDRLNQRFTSYYHADLWLPSRDSAKNWGAKMLKMEIL